MKKNGINAKRYYRLLDWKDKNMRSWRNWFGERSLDSLSVDELNKFDRLIQGKESILKDLLNNEKPNK